MACATEIVEPTAPPKVPNPTQNQAPTLLPPAEETLPDNAFGRLVQQGHAIFVDTKANASEFVGNGLNCTNCHLEQGRKADSAPLWGVTQCTRPIDKRTTRSIPTLSANKGAFSSA